MISDQPGEQGGLVLKTAGGASIIVNDTGIYIKNGQGASLVMKGLEVAINNDGLVIT
jgi:hypothetical protein